MMETIKALKDLVSSGDTSLDTIHEIKEILFQLGWGYMIQRRRHDCFCAFSRIELYPTMPTYSASAPTEGEAVSLAASGVIAIKTKRGLER